MSFYKWSKKLLVRNEFLTDEEKKRGVTKKFAVAEACCCPQWYCVLTEGGEYECRDTPPAPDENAQVLSEHKDETACQKECYERYYCINVYGDYQCKKEGDVREDDDIIGGPYPEDECETECVNCPPCGNEACEAEAAGDNDIIAQCCASLTDDEEWTYDEDAAEWSLTRHCGDNKNTPCRGDDAAGFPDSPAGGDTVNFPCVPNGKVPDDLPDCKKCLFDCDKDAEPPECIPAPDTGQYAKKECEKECAGLWYCTSTSKCERQNPPKNPAKKGYETEDECVAAAPTECALPQCPPSSVAYYWDGSPAVPPEILDSNGGWYIRVDINYPNRPNVCAPCETPDTLVKPYVGFNANFTCDQINESLRAKDQRGPNPLP